MSIVTTLFVAIIGSLITAQLAFHRFRNEKGWERRAKAYDDVVTALHHMSLVLEAEMKAQPGERDPEGDEDKERDAEYAESRRKVAHVATLGGYILGDEARSVLNEFLDRRSDPNNSWDELVFNAYDATSSCLETVIKLARKDLGVKQ